MTNIPESLIEQVPSWDLETTYEHFDLLDPDKRTKRKVEEGIDMMFPIEAIIDANYEEFPRNRKVRIYGFGEGDLIAFKKEIRKRKKEMLKFIYDNYDKDITEGRVAEED